MSSIEESAKKIFSERARTYTTSAAHADEQVLARIVELAAPQPEWVALDVAIGTGHTARPITSRISDWPCAR